MEMLRGKWGRAAIIVAAMMCVGGLSFAQTDSYVVTELRDSDSLPALVRVQVPDQGFVALVQAVSGTPSKSKYQGKNSSVAKEYAITQFAEIQILKIDAKSEKYSAINEFSPYKYALAVTVRLPSDDQTVWFSDGKSPLQWIPLDALSSGKFGSYQIYVDPEKSGDHTIRFLVASWPAGDPLMGFGPRPN
jgi:hypothetical protein